MQTMNNPNTFVKPDYPLSKITGQIIAAAQQVHLLLGLGFEEVFYQRGFALDLPVHGLEFSREVSMEVRYRGKVIGHKRVDFVIDDVMVEIKAKASIEDVDVIQALSYLRASGYEVLKL
jgi:GxxExxY protein